MPASWEPLGDIPSCRPRRDVAVVLVHGYLCISRLFYWHGLMALRRELAGRGYAVVPSCQPRTGAVAVRAQHLARFLDSLPYRRLILLGHSMGGLDARYAASRLDPRRRIGQVVTLGTPHRGTALADWALRDPAWLTRMVRTIDRGALRDLSREGAARLDAEMPDRDDVAYAALAGTCPPEQLIGAWRRFGEQLALDEGDNDGMVSLRSALRGGAGMAVPANHLELIGHRLPSGGAPSATPPSIAALRAVLAQYLH